MTACIYCFAQAAKHYYKKAIEILNKSEFIGGNVDSCIYIKRDEKCIAYVWLYVDNNLMIGDIEVIDKAMTALREKGLVLKVVEGLQDYLFC